MFNPFRKRIIRDLGKNNQICLLGNSKQNFLSGSNNSMKISGDNNHVTFDNIKGFRKGRIRIFGNNNTVIMKSMVCGFLTLQIEADNCYVEIGNNVWFNGTEIFLHENNSKVIIGDKTMMALETSLFCSDFHAITDLSGKPINQGREIIIGEHCWLGKGAKIMKNVALANNTIVGACSLVCKSCSEENVILAGNPAKVVKRDVLWEYAKYDKQEQIYLQNKKDE